MVSMILCLLALQDDPLPRLVERLGDDVAEVREKATAELLNLGETRRSAMEKALKEATVPEVACRLRAVLGKFDASRRRREFKGGPIVDDLGATLSCAYDADTRRLTVSLEVTNLGTTDRNIVAITSWNLSLPGLISSSSSSEGKIQVRQLTGRILDGSFSARTGCGPAIARPALTLLPGERKVFTHTVDASRLTVGDHEVKATFFGKRLAGLSDDLESNAQKFEIRP